MRVQPLIWFYFSIFETPLITTLAPSLTGPPNPPIPATVVAKPPKAPAATLPTRVLITRATSDAVGALFLFATS